jgi:hypothetical protein
MLRSRIRVAKRNAADCLRLAQAMDDGDPGEQGFFSRKRLTLGLNCRVTN